MPEKVFIDEKLGIIRVESYGDVTAEELMASFAAALRYHEERGINRGFVDATRVTSYPSTISIHGFGSQAAPPLRGIKLAIAVSPENRDDPVFFETVTRNRGATVRVFDSPDAALEWLMKEPTKDPEAAE